MNFLKKLFIKNKKQNHQTPPVITPKPAPAPAPVTPGIEPIVVEAVAKVFPNKQDQKLAFEHIFDRKYSNPIQQLGLLYYSGGDIKKFCNGSTQSHPHFWMDEIVPIFRTMEDAEKWVKSISGL